MAHTTMFAKQSAPRLEEFHAENSAKTAAIQTAAMLELSQRPAVRELLFPIAP